MTDVTMDAGQGAGWAVGGRGPVTVFCEPPHHVTGPPVR